MQVVWCGMDIAGNHDFIELLCFCNTPFALPLPCCKNKIECQIVFLNFAKMSIFFENLECNCEETIDLNARTSYGLTALILASLEGHNDVVQLLLIHPESNIDLNAKDVS